MDTIASTTNFSFPERDWNMMPEDFSLQEMLTAAVDRQSMYHDAIRHDIERLFDELSLEQLATLRIVFNALVDDTPGRLAAYYEGVTSQTLKLRFGVCGGCGKDHAAELLDEETPTEPTVRVVHTVYTGGAEQLSLFADASMLDEHDRANMEKYHLDDLRDEATHALLGFICTKCGMKYMTIEDRMLRDPDTCQGCQHKAKWG